MFLLNKRYENELFFFTQKRFLYRPLYYKINFYFFSIFTYNAFQGYFKWAKKTIKNLKFHYKITVIRKKIILNKNKYLNHFEKSILNRKIIILDFLQLYLLFFPSASLNVLHYLKKNKIRKNKLFFYLIFSFKDRQLHINFQDYKKKNFFFLTPGFFLKFFEKKKSLKKNKNLKLLCAKYLRKLYLLNKIKSNIFIIKNNPVYLLEMLNIMHSPIIHKFGNPFDEGNLIEEKDLKRKLIKVFYFIFLRNQDFSKNKIKKKGRIKRKITRKLVLENSITD